MIETGGEPRKDESSMETGGGKEARARAQPQAPRGREGVIVNVRPEAEAWKTVWGIEGRWTWEVTGGGEGGGGRGRRLALCSATF